MVKAEAMEHVRATIEEKDIQKLARGRKKRAILVGCLLGSSPV